MIKLITFISFLILLCNNSNAQWSVVNSAPSSSLNNIIESNGILYLSCAGAGVFISIDSAATWQEKNNGLITSQAKSVYEILVYGSNLYAATKSGIYKSTNNGDEWIKKSSGITIGPGATYEFTESIFEYNGNLITGAYNGMYISTNEAENWTITNISGQGIRGKNTVDHNGILFSARETINDPVGYKSYDGGFTWEDLTGLVYNTIIFFSEPGKLWAGSASGVKLSTDNGITWEDRSDGLGLDPYGSSIIRVNNDLIVALKFGGSAVFISSDDGLNWEDFSSGLPSVNEINKLMFYNNKIYAATSDGLWQREVTVVPVELTGFTAELQKDKILLRWRTASEINNRGFEIERKTENNSFSKIGFISGHGTASQLNKYSFIDRNLNSGLYSYRLKQIDFDGSFTYSNQIEVKISQDFQFSLQQNYPNPFNPTTTIKFRIAESGFVNLKVYDILGGEVAALVNEEKNPGTYEVEFVGSNLSSGIYFYRLKAGAFIQTKKMILLK